jgi:hypothetical protein
VDPKSIVENSADGQPRDTNQSQQQGMEMAKYYVQCGMSQQLVQAEDPRGAALWAVHQVIDQAIDLESIDWTDADEIENLDLIRVMLGLPEQISVSEIGFGRSEAGLFDTPDIMTEWNQLIIAVSRLQVRLNKTTVDAAGSKNNERS